MDDERLSDISDIASREETRETEVRIALARKVEKVPADWDGETCYECGHELPPERIAAKRFKCVRCKTIEEKKAKGY